MKRWWYLIVAAAMLMACKSVPSTEESPAEEPSVVGQPHKGAEPSKNPITVSQEVYDETLAEVRLFVENLNVLISSENYNGWRNALSDEFFARISSPEFLASVSEMPGLKSRRIVLRTPYDYFMHVVVPARSKSRVDEIEFIDTNRVKVFHIEERSGRRTNPDSLVETRRLRLYDLIDTGGAWKIID